MEVLHPRCAGLDVHSRQVTACVREAAGPTVTTEHREFATTTAGLLELSAWLTEAGCTHVAMEATGVYWKPVWHILGDEESLTLVLANARHIRNVPGRKSDQKDAAWIADLLAHGLISGSFVPPAPIQELRDLTRTRKQLVAEIARHTQRLQKTLEDANVKLTRVVTDILGVSSRAVLAALIAGETDPERLADCTTGRLKAGRADIVAAVHSRVTAHHRFLLELHLAQIDALSATVQRVERQADEVLRPFREAADRMTTIPGVSETVARVIISEVGTDMTRFPSAGHLVSWAGLCPRLDESAGKRRSTRIRHALAQPAGDQAGFVPQRRRPGEQDPSVHRRLQYFRHAVRLGRHRAAAEIGRFLRAVGLARQVYSPSWDTPLDYPGPSHPGKAAVVRHAWRGEHRRRVPA